MLHRQTQHEDFVAQTRRNLSVTLVPERLTQVYTGICFDGQCDLCRRCIFFSDELYEIRNNKMYITVFLGFSFAALRVDGNSARVTLCLSLFTAITREGKMAEDTRHARPRCFVARNNQERARKIPLIHTMMPFNTR